MAFASLWFALVYLGLGLPAKALFTGFSIFLAILSLAAGWLWSLGMWHYFAAAHSAGNRLLAPLSAAESESTSLPQSSARGLLISFVPG